MRWEWDVWLSSVTNHRKHQAKAIELENVWGPFPPPSRYVSTKQLVWPLSNLNVAPIKFIYIFEYTTWIGNENDRPKLTYYPILSHDMKRKMLTIRPIAYT